MYTNPQRSPLAIFGTYSSTYFSMNILTLKGGTVVKNLPANEEDEGDGGSIPGSGRSPGVSNGNPLQYSCLENPTDRRAWWATVHGVAQSWKRQHTHIPLLTLKTFKNESIQ